MREEQQQFLALRDELIFADSQLSAGKMMSSEAILYQDRVLAFLNRKHKMVFKLGREFDDSTLSFPVETFSPFKSKKPMAGWFEVDYEYAQHWKELSLTALAHLKSEMA